MNLKAKQISSKKKMKITQGTNGTTSSGIISTLKGFEKEMCERKENLFGEKMSETFSNLGKETNIQIQEDQKL